MTATPEANAKTLLQQPARDGSPEEFVRKFFSFLALFSALLWIDATSALAFREEPPPPYVAYQLKSRAGFFPVPGVHVASPRDARYFDFKKVESILMPAAAPGEEDAPALPLLSYKLKEGKQCSDDGLFCASKRGCSNEAVCAKRPRYTPETLEVTDANAAFVALTIKPDHVLVPADVATDGQASRPDAGALSMDAYTCYRAKAVGLPRRSTIELADSFEATARLFELKRFSHLCLPSSIRGSTVHRGKSALSCYLAKPAKGEPAHERIEALSVFADYQYLGFEAATKKERRVCLPATIGPEPTPWTVDIQVDGELSDWPSAAAFPTDQGTNSIGWDHENIYVSVSHTGLAGAADGISVVVYLGDGENGLLQTPVIGSYAAHLPRPMSLALRFEPAGAGLVVKTSDRGGWSNARTQGAFAAWDSSDGGVELSIPRSLLSEAPNLYAHVSLFDDRPASERNFGGTPRGSEAATELGENRFVSQVIGFTLADDLPPISNGKNFGFETAPPWVPFPQPAPTSGSLRIATFNVGHLEIPVTDAGLIAYIEGVISLIVCAPTLGVPQAYAACVAAANLAVWPVLYSSDDGFEEAFGWESNEVRAQAIAQKLLEADLDVLVLNEVFDESAAEQYVKWLKGKFPFRIERIQPSFAPNPLDFQEGLVEEHYGAYRAQNSGLMLFSRYPLRDLQGPGAFVPTDTEYVVADPGGTQTLLGGAIGGKLAFRTFGDCRKSDCMAGKGVGLVQIDKADRPATVVFTHMQATYGAEEGLDFDVRGQEMQQIRTLVGEISAANRDIYILGDLNIIGRHPDGPPVHNETDVAGNADQIYDEGRQEWLHHFCGLKSDEPGQQLSCSCSAANSCNGFGFLSSPSPFFACGGHPAMSCDADGAAFRDLWAYETVTSDFGQTFPAGGLFHRPQHSGSCIKGTEDDPYPKLGCYGQRLDYILHGLPELVEPDNEVCVQHMRRMYDWVHGPALAVASDHLPVLADLNGRNHYCNPLEAALVELTLDTKPQVVDYNPQLPTEILFPGSMQWFEIKNPGSYSIDVQASSPGTLIDVAFEVYHSTDLSLPISSFHDKTTEWGTRFHFPDPPYFVRVYAVDSAGRADRTTQGAYELTIHRHACTTPDDACSLMAGGSTEAWWPDYKGFSSWAPSDHHSCQGSTDPNCTEPDALWFLFRTYRDDRGELPHIDFPASGSCMSGIVGAGRPLSLEVVEEVGASGVHDRVKVPVGEGGSVSEFDQVCLPVHSCTFSTDCQEQLTCSTTSLEAPQQDLLPPLAYNTTPELVDQLSRKSEDYFLRVLRPDPWTGDSAPATAGCDYDEPSAPPPPGFCESENFDCGSPSSTRRIEVSFETDMTFLFPMSIKIFNPEDPISSQDEVFHRFQVNGGSVADPFKHPAEPGPHQGWKVFHSNMKIDQQEPFKVGPFGYSRDLNFSVVEDGWPTPEDEPDYIGGALFSTLESNAMSDPGPVTKNMASPGAEAEGRSGHYYATYTCRRHALPDKKCMMKDRGVSCCTEPLHPEP